jgi:predicted phosphodiesterase
MIEQAIKDNILSMFLSGAATGTVLATFPNIGKTTIYNIRAKAAALQDTGMVPMVQSRPTGVIGDTHIPFEHPRYLEFCLDTFLQHNVANIVHIGDLVDNHAMSYHESDPDGDSAGMEWDRAQDHLAAWYEAFPEVTWLSGNHDNIPKRKLMTAGLTKRILRSNLYGIPEGWINREDVILDDVFYSHGIGMAGINGHRNHAITKGMSAVMGHCHSFGGVAYVATPFQIMFGMNAGCGLDIEAYAMAYGKHYPHRPTLGCGIVFSPEVAMFVPMNMWKYSRHNK